MNAKNVTPDETAPKESAAAKNAKAVDEVDAAADTAAKPVAEKQVAGKQVTPAAEKPATPVVAKTAKPVDAQPADTVPAPVEGDNAASNVTATEAAPVHAPVHTVYVTAPEPPRPKGNRGMGIVFSLLAAIVFSAVYVGVAALLTLFVNPSGVVGAVSTFLTSPLFYVPVLVFLVAMVLWALLANRASWWSWVIGSFVIAALTYFASIGIFLLMEGGFGLTPSAAVAAFAVVAVHPALIAAALIARECAIWFGAAVAKRGRKVRERNYEAWQAFENEQAQKRAEFGGTAAA